jgi:sigma-B regulation protein RsbU (phosphoserine phosphatase)
VNALPARVPASANERRALTFLADLSQTLALSLDLKKTLTLAIKRIAGFMQAEAASMFLIEPGSDVIECKICVGPVDIRGLKLAIGQGVVGRTVAENKPQVVLDARSDTRVNVRVDAETGFVTRSILCVPLATAQGPIGAIEVINRRGGGLFDAADAEILRLIAAPTALAIHNAQLAGTIVEQQRIRREVELARTVQKSLLPKRRRGKFPLIGVNLPAHEISGDFYDYFDLPDGRIAFFIGDISGKGLDAAFLMVRVASLLRWAGKEAPTPALWLSSINVELYKTLRNGRFVCAVVGQYNRRTREVEFASAGFPPALLHDGGDFEEIHADGPPLGILGDASYTQQRLALGTRALYFFSDGATDVRNAQGQTLGSAGLRDIIARHAGLAPEARLRALIGELRHLRLVDDTTLLLLQEPRGSTMHMLLDLKFPARAEEMRHVRAALRAALDSEDVAPELRDRLVLAVDEACTNIIRHAYSTCAPGTIALRLSRERDMLAFELRDEAPAVDPAQIRPRDLSECRAGGLGVAFIDELMDSWRVEPLPGGRGNILIMQKKLVTKAGTDL